MISSASTSLRTFVNLDRLTARRTGIADEELAKKEAERGRKRKSDDDASPDRVRKHWRSSSPFSSTSVSTISTNLSRSPSPTRSLAARARQAHGSHKERMSISPDVRERGRRTEERANHDNRKRRRTSRSSSRSYSSDASSGWRRRSRSEYGDRNTRRRHSSISPDTRGRDRSPPRTRSKRWRSRSTSRDRSHIARTRQSMPHASPSLRERVDGNQSHLHPPVSHGGRYPEVTRDDDGRGTNRGRDDANNRPTRPAPPPRKERSLSPFSKRLALTQAMNMGNR